MEFDPAVKLMPVGYEALVSHYDLHVIPHFRESYVGRETRSTLRRAAREQHIFPKEYLPKSDDFLIANLEFALKYDGVNLGILKAVFEAIDPHKIESYVRSQPTGKYARRIWFFYEWLTGKTLDLTDATLGNYVDAIDPRNYIVAKGSRSRRHRVLDNLLGPPSFCPMIRKTELLARYHDKDLSGRSREIVASFDPSVLARATEYLYMKETRSSYAIERETPDQRRASQFVELLKRSRSVEHLDKPFLLELQNTVVDPRYANDDYRSSQVYVGETRPDLTQLVHFIGPKPKDVGGLMSGLVESMERMALSEIDPIAHAAAISFGFVFIHPFDDGNGRIHRYLIHHILSKRSFTPPGMILPVSAAMLARRYEYDACLESFSRALMPLIDYRIDEDGIVMVRNETVDHFRYIDATAIAEYLYALVEKTIETDFIGEMRYLMRYDRAKRRIQDVVDLPDRQLNLFLKVCLENEGRLSKRKRDAFGELSDEEVERLETIVRETMIEPARRT